MKQIKLIRVVRQPSGFEQLPLKNAIFGSLDRKIARLVRQPNGLSNKSIVFLTIIFLLVSCNTTSGRTENTERQIRPTSAIRLGDIERQLDNPVSALNLIYIFKEVYSHRQSDENKEWLRLLELEQIAIENLRAAQVRAVEEERWVDAASLGRSLASIGVETDWEQPALYLSDAKKNLSQGNILGAFLSAVKSHNMQPLDQTSALLFLEKAVEVRQRRSAAFFLNAAESAGVTNIPAALREYALGRDSVPDMVNGVATVIVDRGIRIERGRGIPDRVVGSAFFVDSSGLLITNYHVIESEVDPRFRGTSRLFIRMGDPASPRIPARVVGWDQALDLALIRAEIDVQYVFSVIDHVIPQVGETVLAIGSPVGLERTVSSGIVSALGRRFLQIGDVIQIDAAVNQGNSGGPVIDSEGRLVGVVFAGIPQFQGLNFAVPAEMLAAALPAMLRGGGAQRPWLGMSIAETIAGTAEIIYTAPNTPASRNLIREGSTITSINGKTITASQGRLIPAMQEAVFQLGPNELVALETVNQRGEVRRNIVKTAARPELPLLEAARIDRQERIAAPLFGMILTPAGGGLFSSNFTVTGVVRGSITDEAGISVNDPLSIRRFRIFEREGFAVMEITVRQRRMGFLETTMQLPARLDSPDTL